MIDLIINVVTVTYIHSPVILSSYAPQSTAFALENILVLLAKHDLCELCGPVTALISLNYFSCFFSTTLIYTEQK